MTGNSINNQIGLSTENQILSHIRAAAGQWQGFNDQTDTFGFYNRAGTPEGNIAANIGSMCIDTSTGDLYMKTTDTVNTGWVLVAASSTFSVVNQTFTANNTYTPTTGMVYCTVEMVGGGGGSGGTAATGVADRAVTGGGGGGEYAKGIFSAATIGASQAVTIGAGGAGGAAGNNPGSTGGTTSLGALLTAVGGSGSVGGPSTSYANTIKGAGGAGGTGGAGGYLRFPGQAGGLGYTAQNTAGVQKISGSGGSSFYGTGAYGYDIFELEVTSAGASGTGYGAGARGAVATNSQAAVAGADGTAGIVIVTEYVIS